MFRNIMDFYTNFSLMGNNVYLRGIKNSQRILEKIPYNPYLFVTSKDHESKYSSIYDKKVERIDFETPSEARKFIETYKDVASFEVYGSTKFAYTYIFDQYKHKEIEFDISLINIVYLDIEVASDEGFPNIQKADKPVTAISLKKGNKYIVLGCGDYVAENENIEYFKCKDEHALLSSFLKIWQTPSWCPDVISGWNIEFFDIPYLVNRIEIVLGEGESKKLSPWGILEESNIESRGRTQQSFIPLGVSVLDYVQLYDKFTYVKRESKKLDYIAKVELKEQKLDYSEYGSLLELYKNNHQKFIQYNLRDTELVSRLEDKLKLIELVLSMSYDAKVNYNDVMGTVKQWEIICHNYLLERNKVVPMFKHKRSDRVIAGGYVKDPIPGSYNWVVSFDLTSLYPHLIMQYNISPDTYVGMFEEETDPEFAVNRLLNGYMDTMQIDDDVSVAANMSTYRKDKEGFLPALMDKFFKARDAYKDAMKAAKKQLIACDKSDINEVKRLENEISRLNNLQMSKKIQLNSLYGALANEWCLFFDTRFAEGITMSGQLSVKWVERDLNMYLNKLLKTTGTDYIISIDTDSAYINLESFVKLASKDKTYSDKEIVNMLDKFCEKVLQSVINDSFEKLHIYMKSYQNKMHMKREAIASKGIWMAKKRYILNVFNNEGIAYDPPELKITGIEAVRSSTPEIVRDLIKKTISVSMNSSEGDMQKMIENAKNEFFKRDFDEIAFPRGVNNLEKYTDAATIYSKGTPLHVRGSLLYNTLLEKRGLADKYEKIFEGSKVKFSYLKLPNPIKENVIAAPEGVLPKELGLDQYIDYDLQWQKSFSEPMDSILKSLGWSSEKTFNLEEFF